MFLSTVSGIGYKGFPLQVAFVLTKAMLARPAHSADVGLLCSSRSITAADSQFVQQLFVVVLAVLRRVVEDDVAVC